MNCTSQRVRRSEELFSRKEYEEKLAALTPEERQRREQQGKEAFNKVFGILNAIGSQQYSSKNIWKD